MNHLVFLQADEIAKIRAGTKRVESRLWRGRFGHPCTRATTGDVFYLKRVGGGVKAVARVAHVHVFRLRSVADLAALAARFGAAMDCAPDDPYWVVKQHSTHARLFWLADVTPWKIPQAALPRAIRIGWVADWHPPLEADATLLMPQVFPPPGKVAGDFGEQLPLVED